MTDYSAAISAVDIGNQTAAQSIVGETSPDDAARAFQLADATGVPADHIGKDVEGFEQQNKQGLARSIVADNGYIQDFVNKHPLHGPLISDDLGTLDKLSRSYRRLTELGFSEATHKGFAEGFGNEPFGSYLTETRSPAWNELARRNIFATQMLTTMGLPFEFATRLTMGGIEGARQGLTTVLGKKTADEFASMALYEVMKPEFRATIQAGRTAFEYLGEGEVLPPEAAPRGGLPPKGPQTIEGEAVDLGRRRFLQSAGATVAAGAVPKAAADLGKGPRLTDTMPPQYAARQATTTPGPMSEAFGTEIAKAMEEFQTLRPWLEAGEEPPAGLSRVTDALHEERAKIDQDIIKEALDHANSSALRERAPEKFEEFLDAHPSGTLSIGKEAIARNPAAFDWIPDLKAKIESPPGKLEVSAKDFLLNFDKELWPEFKDDISRGGLTVNEAKEIVAWHGSPHDFDRFDLSKIGTGQGAQTYGYGLYFAENPEVAGTYRPMEKAVSTVQDADGGWSNYVGGQKVNTFRTKAEAVADSDRLIDKVKTGGRMYQVRIKAEPEHFLDWDKPLSEQSEKVREVLKGLGQPEGNKYLQRTGETALKSLRTDLKSDQAVTEKLRAAGIPGIKYLDQGSRAGGDGTSNFVVFDDSLINITHKDGKPVTPEERETLTRPEEYKPRPSELPDGMFDQRLRKVLTEQPELRQVPWDIEKNEPMDAKWVQSLSYDDYIKLLNGEELESLGRKVLERGRSGRPIRTEPLGDTERLISGIRRAAGLDPQGGILEPLIEEAAVLPPETLAAPQAQPFTAGKAFGRTQKEYTKYLELIAKQDEELTTYLQRRAEAQAKRENSAAWKAERSRLEPEVRDEVSQRPEIAAWRFFDKGEAFGQTLPRRPKLNRADVRAMRDRGELTQDTIDSLPEGWFSDKGLHPDQVAHMFGYQTGGELADVLAAVAREAEGTKGDIVDRLTEAELQRRLERTLGEDAAERLEEAKDHALSLTTMEMLHQQVLALGTRLGVELPLDKGRMDWGSLQLLKEQRFGSLTSTKLLTEAGKAGRRLEQALLGEKPLDAFREAQYHYTVTQMAKEMMAVEKETKKFERQARQYRKRDAGPDTFESKTYTNWIHNILMRVGRPVERSVQDLKDEISARTPRERTLPGFLLSKLDEGTDLAVPDFLLDPGFRKPIEQMTVQEARLTMKAIDSLIYASNEEGKVYIGGAKRDLAEARAEVNKQLATLGPATEPKTIVWNLLRQIKRKQLQAAFLFDRMDYGNVFGLVTQWAWRPMAEADNARAKLSREMSKEFRALEPFKNIDPNASVPNVLFKNWQTGLQADGKIDWSVAAPKPFTQKNLLAVMHHVGNPDNLARLAEGYGLEPQQVMDWVKSLAKKEHWDYVQAHGDLFKKLKKMSDEVYRRTVGQAPEAVDIFPIDTPFGRYDGWYHPIIHDPLWAGSYKNEKADGPFAKEYVMAMPSAGYTKERTNYRGPLDLELDSIANNLNQRIHDISFREAVINANKLVGNSTFQNHVTSRMGKDYTQMLQRWVHDVANGANIDSANQGAGMQIFEFFRQNTISALIGLNFRTVEKHTITAAINSMSEVGPANFLDEFRQIALNPTMRNANWKFAMEKFEELQRRHQNFIENITGGYQHMINPPGRDWISTFNAARQWSISTGTAPVAFFDLYSAVPTALAKYNDMKALGKSEGDAVFAANEAVRRAHGTSAITSRPEITRDQPWMASLFGFFNHIFNQQYKLMWQAAEAGGHVKKGEWSAASKYGTVLALGVFSYVVAPAIIEELVTPYHDSEKDSWQKKAFKSLGLGLSSSYVGVRDIARAIIDGKDPTLGLGGTSAKSITDLVRDLNPSHKYGFDKDHAGKTIKHAIVAFGVATGLTNAEEGNLAEYLYNLHIGKEKPPRDAKALWRGLTKGTSTPPSGPDYIERLLPGRVYHPSRR